MLHQIKKKLKYFFLHIFIKSDFYFIHSGYCPCCDKNVTFKSTNNWLRDNFFCDNCVSIPRERAIMLVIEKYFKDWKNLKIHESSPGNKGASLKLKNQCKNYIATQFYPNEKTGSKFGEFFNLDLENQYFKEEEFDLVVTQDVFEHIMNPEKAFIEITRTLKPGGAHVFTTPLVNKFRPSERWAELNENNKLKFLKEPEYHGNPVDPKGSPVTMHWGYDIVDFIKKHTGLETEIFYTDDLNFGIRAEFNEVLITRKPLKN